MIKDIFNYRFFILSSIKNEFTQQFARSQLGSFWVVLNPLFQVLIYTLILSNILSTKLPGAESKYAYAIYLMSGLLGWSLFNPILTKGLNIFVQNANLIKKLAFPRITLPIIVMGTELVSNFFLFIVMITIFTILGHQLSWSILWFFPIGFLFALFTISLGILFGIFNVFIRDIGQLLPALLQVWFWFTPILYPLSIVPEKYIYLFDFNPIYPFIRAYHRIIYDGQAPEFLSLAGCVIMTFMVFLLGLVVFRKTNSAMADEL